MPAVQRDNPLRQGACVPVVRYDEPSDPFLSGFMDAASFAYDYMFGPILGPLWFEGSTFTPDPMTA